MRSTTREGNAYTWECLSVCLSTGHHFQWGDGGGREPTLEGVLTLDEGGTYLGWGVLTLDGGGGEGVPHPCCEAGKETDVQVLGAKFLM